MPGTALHCEPLEPRSLLTTALFPPLPVLTADLTGNGLTDLAILRTNSDTGTSQIELHRAVEDGSFAQPTTAELPFLGASLHWYPGEDGTILAVVGQLGPQSAAQYLQVGPEGELSFINLFSTSVSNSVSSSFTPWQAAPVAADLTGDGMQDLATLDEQGRILVRLGLPDGRFLLPQLLGGGVRVAGLAHVATPEGNRLVALSRQTAEPTLLFFTHDPASGSFLMTEGPILPRDTIGFWAGDFNASGRDDLAVSSVDGFVRVWLQESDGSFAPQPGQVFSLGVPTVLGGQGGLLFAASLFDGQLFSLSAPEMGEIPSVDMPLYVAAGPGVVVSGNVGSATVRIVEAGSSQVFAAQGLGGVVVGAGWVAVLDRDEGKVAIYIRDNEGQYALSALHAVGSGTRGLSSVVVSTEGGSRMDLLISTRTGDVVRLESRGEGIFRYAGRASTEVSLLVMDIDGDGIDDFVHSTKSLDRIEVQTSSGGKLQLGSIGDELAGGVILVDLNGDGILDLVVCNATAGTVLIYPGLGGGQFGPEIHGGRGTRVAAGPVAVAAADLGRDSLDLVVVSQGADVVTILTRPDDGSLWPTMKASSLAVGLRPSSVVVEDINGDGLLDLLVVCSGSNSLWIIPGLGDGRFDPLAVRILQTGPNPTRAVVADFNGSGYKDILSVNSGANTLSYYPDVTLGGSVVRLIELGGMAPVSVFARDVNQDGIADLIVSTYANNQVSLLMGGINGPAWHQSLSVPATSWSLAVGTATAPAAVWVMDIDSGAAWLLEFSLEGGPGPEGPLRPAEGGPFDLSPLEQGAVPLVPLFRMMDTEAAEEGPAGNLLTTLALLAPASGREGSTPLGGSTGDQLPAEELLAAPLSDSPAALSDFLLGTAASPPLLPPEGNGPLKPLDRVPPSSDGAFIHFEHGDVVFEEALFEEDEEETDVAGVEGLHPDGDDHLARFLLAMSLGSALWLGHLRQPRWLQGLR